LSAPRAHTTVAATQLAAIARVPLLCVDADLRAAVPADELGIAARTVTAPCRHVGPGSWLPEPLGEDTGAFAALLVRGLVTHEITIAGRRSAQLLGPGDVLHPWRVASTAVPHSMRWACDAPATIAVLDGRFLAAARRWPGLFGVLHERLAEQLDRANVGVAILGLPRVEQRVLGAFWQLADRWGTVRPDGVVIRLAVSHALIGQLIGAQRPTVSLALQGLAEAELLRRTGRDAWILAHDSRDVLDPEPCNAAGPVQTVRIPSAAGSPADETLPRQLIRSVAPLAGPHRG
jgi:CRP/FNR family transcriptional regulator, cyclic AMP receptor protein